MPTREQTTILRNLPTILKTIRRLSAAWKRPVVGLFAEGPHAAYQVLISTVLSLRTKDAVTEKASRRLFALASSPEQMVRLKPDAVEKAIYPVGFYRTKAAAIVQISRILIERYGGRVPDTLEELLALPGVGLKTANLTLSLAHKKDAICVDVHVHRITNRWGLVKTGSPDETEKALRELLPRKYWAGLNELLVAYGQNICVPVSPFCSKCPLAVYCAKIGVKSSR